MRYLIYFFALGLLLPAFVFAGGIGTEPQPQEIHFEPFVLLSAGHSDLRLFMARHAAASPEKITAWQKDLEGYVQQWHEKKEAIGAKQLLEQLFYDVHRRYFKHYTPYTGVQALLKTGEYNCLSATALLALLLDQLGYSYTIVEASSHVVLLVKVAEQDVLLETTEPLTGFVAEPAAVQGLLRQMKRAQNSTQFYSFNLPGLRLINLRELAGLQYFNRAAWYFNQGQYKEAAAEVQKGEILYQTKRFTLLKELIAESSSHQ